jgi:glycosyltransferase involved in cell wall biosynthesis
LAENLDVLFLGTFDPALRDLALSTIDRWRLHDIVHLEGAVPYESGLRLLINSNVLLIIGDSSAWHRSAIPAKLFEYLGARKPILALLPDGPAADVLREANAGLIVPPDDVGAIAEAIWGLYQRGRNGELIFPVNEGVAGRFAWSALAGQLASTFDQAFAARVAG